MARVLLIFLDGVGIGEADPGVNPFFAADLPTWSALAGGLPSLDTPRVAGDVDGRRSVAFPVDATLGVEGTPQSGTGQTSLLTGRNGATEFGRHFGPWIPTSLRPAVRDENVLVRARDAGRSIAFANAYPPGWPGERSRRRVAGPPLAALGAGVLDRHAAHLAQGEAVASEIVNEGWIRHLGPADLPRPTAAQAGRSLARIAASTDLTLFAHYGTDTAGHRQEMAEAVAALEQVDDFLGGVLDSLPRDHRLVIVSDHGNVEDVRGGHTRNPALGMIVDTTGGDGSRVDASTRELRSLTDVPDVVLGLLD